MRTSHDAHLRALGSSDARCALSSEHELEHLAFIARISLDSRSLFLCVSFRVSVSASLSLCGSLPASRSLSLILSSLLPRFHCCYSFLVDVATRTWYLIGADVYLVLLIRGLNSKSYLPSYLKKLLKQLNDMY